MLECHWRSTISRLMRWNAWHSQLDWAKRTFLPAFCTFYADGNIRIILILWWVWACLKRIKHRSKSVLLCSTHTHISLTNICLMMRVNRFLTAWTVLNLMICLLIRSLCQLDGVAQLVGEWYSQCSLNTKASLFEALDSIYRVLPLLRAPCCLFAHYLGTPFTSQFLVRIQVRGIDSVTSEAEYLRKGLPLKLNRDPSSWLRHSWVDIIVEQASL